MSVCVCIYIYIYIHTQTQFQIHYVPKNRPWNPQHSSSTNCKLKIQDKNPSYKCDLKVPPLKNIVQVNTVKFNFHRETECNLTPLTASYCCPGLAPNSPPFEGM